MADLSVACGRADYNCGDNTDPFFEAVAAVAGFAGVFEDLKYQNSHNM